MLALHHRFHLLRIARQSIEAVLDGRRDEPPGVADEELMRPCGTFVSLHTGTGDLRGCIGTIKPVSPLIRAVATSAVNAAFRDPRFQPLRRDELDTIRIEISVMSPIVPVERVEEIVVGRDGLIVSRGGRTGLLLPQVATSFGWDRETFLEHTCLKAGLGAGAWRDSGCRIEKFSAEVFAE
jgi:AmmeMemoRadiSam system protein A